MQVAINVNKLQHRLAYEVPHSQHLIVSLWLGFPCISDDLMLKSLKTGGGPRRLLRRVLVPVLQLHLHHRVRPAVPDRARLRDLTGAQ